MSKEIRLRKLPIEEHGRTRKLWEEIFTEDSAQFLDYYYSIKAKENEIYVMEENDDIVSMVHLNPYQMRIGETIYPTHYIVAVATKEKCRGKGYMRKLLNHVMDIMKERGEPFTFLMPAAEAIYTPFGFRVVYESEQKSLEGKSLKDDTLVITNATKQDCQELASFANLFLENYDVATWRTESYYRMILEEQKSENGGILLAKRNGEIVGILCYGKEEKIEIREPMFLREEDMKHAVYVLTGTEGKQVQCFHAKIMTKVLQPTFENLFKNEKVFINEVV